MQYLWQSLEPRSTRNVLAAVDGKRVYCNDGNPAAKLWYMYISATHPWDFLWCIPVGKYYIENEKLVNIYERYH